MKIRSKTRSWKSRVAKRVALSTTHLTPDDVAAHHAIVEAAIHLYHTDANPDFETRFAFYSEDEIRAERDESLYEAGAASAMMVLASIEASFRSEFLRRCYARKKDILSQELRKLYKHKGPRVSLADDLLQAWKKHGALTERLTGNIRSVFGYRNWLAHGRYYTPKLGRAYDFADVYNLACEVEEALSSPRYSG